MLAEYVHFPPPEHCRLLFEFSGKIRGPFIVDRFADNKNSENFLDYCRCLYNILVK